jgi:hypothetical protein
MLLRRIVLAALLLCALANTARAESFRCPDSELLVDIGDTMAQVQAKCGPPTAQQNIKGGKRGGIAFVQWLYDFGPAYFTRVLIFQARGYLIKIDDGGYGGAH